MLFSVICLWTIVVLGIFYIIKNILACVVKIYYLQKLPGPPKTSILFGNLDFRNKTRAEIFSTLRKWASQYYPIYKIWMCHESAANLLSPEDFETILSSIKHEKKSGIYDILQRWLKTGLLTSVGKKWQFRRKILTPAFHLNILQNFMVVFNAETEDLVKVLRGEVDKNQTDIVPIISQFTLKALGESAMGTKLNFDTKMEIEYKNAIYDIAHLYIHRILRPWLFYNFSYVFFPCCFRERQIVNTLHSFTKKVIEKRETEFRGLSGSNGNGKKKRLAMLDLLLSAKAEGLIDDEGIREEVDTFMFEGHDTSATAIGFCLMLIACHKEVQNQIIAEMRAVLGDTKRKPSYNDLQELKYLERCIKESLRLYPGVFFISRILGEDLITSTGYELKKGSIVVLHIYDLHRNPDIYPDPERFDPDRFLPENCQQRHPFAYVPFSAGPRNCIGQKFVILELKALICGVLANFILEPIDTPDTIVLVIDIVLRSRDGIKIKFVSRDN